MDPDDGFPPLESFLVLDNDAQVSKVAQTGSWLTVLKDLNVTSSGDSKNSDVEIQSANFFWGLKFSSVQNLKYFATAGTTLSINELKNNAWINDNLHSGIMLLADTPTSGTPLLGTGSISTTFGLVPYADEDLLNAVLKVFSGLQGIPHPISSISTPLNPNALWCVTTQNGYTRKVQLSYDIKGSFGDNSPVSEAVGFLKDTLGLDIPAPNITLPDFLITVSKYDNYSLENLTLTESYSLSIKFALKSLDLWIDYTQNDLQIILLPTESLSDIFSSLVTALGGAVGVSDDEIPSISDDAVGRFFKHVSLWYVKLDKKPSALNWGIALLLTWSVGSSEVVVSLSYDSGAKIFTGELILQDSLPTLADRMRPDYDNRTAISTALISHGIDPDTVPDKLKLWELFGLDGEAPTFFPTDLRGASVSYQMQPGGNQFTFFIDLTGDSQPQDDDEAPSSFVWSDLTVKLEVTTHKASQSSMDPSSGTTKPDIDLLVHTAMALYPEHDSTIVPATLSINLQYQTTPVKQWFLNASAFNVSVALIADHFDLNCRSGAMAVLGGITLKSLQMYYLYASGKAASFLISGVLVLGDLELDLYYQFVSTQVTDGPTAAEQAWNGAPPKDVDIVKPKTDTKWAFEALLRTGSPDSTVGSIAESIKPGSSSSLPDFVSNIPVSAATDPTNSLVKLRLSGDDDKGTTLAVWVSIGDFNLTFVQFRTSSTGDAKAVVKRLVRISVDRLPFMDDVPLVGRLPQPFDHLIYLWVQDENPDEADPTKKGFTRGQLEGVSASAINTILTQMGVPPIQLSANKAQPQDSDLELSAGNHFQVIANGKLVVDHAFQNAKTATTTSEPSQSGTNGQDAGTASSSQDPTADAAEPAASKGTTNTKAGTLSVSGLSLQFKHGSLFVGVDATLNMGALTFSVRGFTLQIDMSGITLDNLQDLLNPANKKLHISFSGLEAGVSKPPLTIKGVFLHATGVDKDNHPYESFQGGVDVGLKEWNMLAVGEYRETTISSGRSLKSVFMYGKLDGPLIELELVALAGVRFGYGVNSAIITPSADNLYGFPFLNDGSDSTTGPDPMNVLTNLLAPPPPQTPYVYTKESSTWICAGFTLTGLECLKLTAVAMFEIDPSPSGGIALTIMGDAVFQMEPDAPAELSLFYVELLIKVEVNFVQGYIAADAALAPTSHVFVPEAHLTGGASLYAWWPPNTHFGDWVVSFGGYHKAFRVPAHYPNPARLGLSFIVGDMIHIVGEGYMAVTPKCAMAGGSLHLSLSVGPVSAYCDVTLDVFINFKPFSFVAELSISVGVECDIDILFIHIHISIHIGADMQLWGPNNGFGGLAHVDFWFFDDIPAITATLLIAVVSIVGFDVSFGPDRPPIQPISLVEFYLMVLTPGPDKSADSDDNPYLTMHKYSLEDGLFPIKPTSDQNDANAESFPNTGATKEWQVQAMTLRIRIDCDFSVSSAAFVTNETDPQDLKTSSIFEEGDLDDIYSFPMGNTVPIKSRILIRVYSLETADGKPRLLDNFQGATAMKSAAAALWKKYSVADDPLLTPNPSSLSGADSPTTPMCQGIRLIPPPPMLAKSPIVDFDATAAMESDFSGDLPIPLETQQSVFLGINFTLPPPPPPGKPASTETLWDVLADTWAGKDDVDGGQNKAWTRGDTAVASKKTATTAAATDPDTTEGMMAMCASLLGWNRRKAVPASTSPTPAATAALTVPTHAALTPAALSHVDEEQDLLPNHPPQRQVLTPAATASSPPPAPAEWQLQSNPPSILISELKYYYPDMPMQTLSDL